MAQPNADEGTVLKTGSVLSTGQGRETHRQSIRKQRDWSVASLNYRCKHLYHSSLDTRCLPYKETISMDAQTERLSSLVLLFS